MHNLPQERLVIALGALAAAEAAFEMTLAYCKERTAFGQPIGTFQHSRFKLAEMKTELHVGRVYIDHCVILQVEKQLSAEEAGEVPKAFVVRKAEITADEIMAWVAQRVAPQKKIRRLEFIDAIPKSLAGKILRRVLAEQERARATTFHT
jgi:alkylation response protein AidB-like acyl-CoA dehydrogenase